MKASKNTPAGERTPNEKAVMGACNTQTASETTNSSAILAPAQDADKFLIGGAT